jgi:hypothetical protein
MKYILISGWEPIDEWHEFCIGVFDKWEEAVGKAYSELDERIHSCCLSDALTYHVTTDEGKTKVEYLKYSNGKQVFLSDLVGISTLYPMQDESGWFMRIEELKHDEYDTDKSDVISSVLGDYVRIFVYNDEKEDNDSEM